MAYLVCEGDDGGSSHTLGGEKVVAGRDADCDLIVADRSASAHHCEFQRIPDGWRVVDLESRHGTRVNGKYVNHKVLVNGDKVLLGSATYVYHEGDPEPEAAPALAPIAEAAPVTRKRRSKKRSASARPPAKGNAARAPARGAPSRGGRAAPSRRRRGGRDEWEEEDERPDRRRTRRQRKSGADKATVFGIVIPSVLVLGLIMWWLIMPEESTNRRIVNQMLAAKDRTDWPAMITAAAGADPSDQYR